MCSQLSPRQYRALGSRIAHVSAENLVGAQPVSTAHLAASRSPPPDSMRLGLAPGRSVAEIDTIT
eukprot:3568165-Rhodomonas_salina.2